MIRTLHIFKLILPLLIFPVLSCKSNITNECKDSSKTTASGCTASSSTQPVDADESYTITYTGNGSTRGTVPEPEIGKKNASITVKGNSGSLEKDGFDFSKWNTAVDGSGTSYSEGEALVIGSSNITLYAQWTAESERPSGTLDTFQNLATGLPVSIVRSSSIQIGNKIYLVGGQLGATPDPTSIGLASGVTSAVFEATISNDGTPGTFSKSSYALTTARQGASIIKIGSYVYVVGGYTATGNSGTSSTIASIERASVDATGVTSNFSTFSTSLAEAKSRFTFLATSSYLYIIGGTNSSNYHSDTIQRAPIDPSTGTLGSFTILTRNSVSGTEASDGLVLSRGFAAGIKIGSNYFVIGGEGTGSPSTKIEKAAINPDGTLGNFVLETGVLSHGRGRATAVALDDKVVIYGGYGVAEVETAPISLDEIGTFSDLSGNALPVPLEDGTPLLTRKGLYLFGGSPGGSAVSSAIQFAPLVK